MLFNISRLFPDLSPYNQQPVSLLTLLETAVPIPVTNHLHVWRMEQRPDTRYHGMLQH